MSKKLLIIDDDVEFAKTMADILETKDYVVEIANDGLQAIEKSNEGNVDLILLDICMPFFSGFWFCDAFKQRPKTKDIPVVVISGLTDAKDIRKAYKVGACAYVKKPFEAAELIKVIEKYLAA